MQFNRLRVEAELILGYIRPRELALLALESGLDGLHISRLAASDDPPTAYEQEVVLPRAMLEMDLIAISPRDAAVRMAVYRVRDIIEKELDPLLHTSELEKLWIASDYSDVLQPVGSLDDDVYLSRAMGEAETVIRSRVLEVLRQFIDRRWTSE